SWTAWLLETANRFILRRANLIVALDRFMADRLAERGISREKILVLPPWSPQEQIEKPAAGQANAFRARHGLENDFVVMYSGNHSPSNPVLTLLDAAVRLMDEPGLKFLFVGGGSAKAKIEACIQAHDLTNVLSLPYQPLAELNDSLGAADVHVVTLGNSMV